MLFFSLRTSFNLHTSSLNVVANYSCFATSIPKSMLLGGHPLNDWSMKFNDQVHRLSKLQKNMVHLSRRIGPRQHGLLIDLVNLHDRLRSLTSHFQKNLLHFRRDLSPLIETEKNILKSTVPHATNKNTIDNTSFHASTSKDYVVEWSTTGRQRPSEQLVNLALTSSNERLVDFSPLAGCR
ncbi:Large ribosomal subunit protein [Trichinella pseudospiralis]